MRRLAAIITLAIAVMAPLGAKRVRTGPTRTPSAASAPKTAETQSIAQQTDTVAAPEAGTVKLSGYDKTLRANRESFFVTNALPDSSTIIALDLTFDYCDMSGRQLHKVTRTVRCDIPFGETRNLSVASWDKQHTFYYYLSPAPARSAGTPFRVTSTVERVVTVSPE